MQILGCHLLGSRTHRNTRASVYKANNTHKARVNFTVQKCISHQHNYDVESNEWYCKYICVMSIPTFLYVCMHVHC